MINAMKVHEALGKSRGIKLSWLDMTTNLGNIRPAKLDSLSYIGRLGHGQVEMTLIDTRGVAEGSTATKMRYGTASSFMDEWLDSIIYPSSSPFPPHTQCSPQYA